MATNQRYLLLIGVLDIAKLKHASAAFLSGKHGVLKLFQNLRIGHGVSAALAINRRQSFRDKISVDARMGVIGGGWVGWVDEAQVERRPFFVVNVRDELSAFARGAESLDRFCVVIAICLGQFHEACVMEVVG